MGIFTVHLAPPYPADFCKVESEIEAVDIERVLNEREAVAVVLLAQLIVETDSVFRFGSSPARPRGLDIVKRLRLQLFVGRFVASRKLAPVFFDDEVFQIGNGRALRFRVSEGLHGRKILHGDGGFKFLQRRADQLQRFLLVRRIGFRFHRVKRGELLCGQKFRIGFRNGKIFFVGKIHRRKVGYLSFRRGGVFRDKDSYLRRFYFAVAFFQIFDDGGNIIADFIGNLQKRIEILFCISRALRFVYLFLRQGRKVVQKVRLCAVIGIPFFHQKHDFFAERFIGGRQQFFQRFAVGGHYVVEL